jgi:hypothetical protein
LANAIFPARYARKIALARFRVKTILYRFAVETRFRVPNGTF